MHVLLSGMIILLILLHCIFSTTGHVGSFTSYVTTSVKPLAHCAALGQKNRKYLSICYATSPQVGHRVIAVYLLLITTLIL